MNRFLSICSLLSILCLYSVAWAGSGQVKIVKQQFGGGQDLTIGEIELIVNLTDYTNDEYIKAVIEEQKKRFITASTILCDATDGFFRIGKVTFVRNPAGRADADVWLLSDLDREDARIGGLGLNPEYRNNGSFSNAGAHARIWYPNESATSADRPTDAATLAHELAHYVLGVRDEYADTGWAWGEGFEPSQLDENNCTLMVGATSMCFIRQADSTDPTGEVWVKSDRRCNSVTECLDLASGGAIWGEGPNDNVKCSIQNGTELSIKRNFDRLNGLGVEFDGRVWDDNIEEWASFEWGWAESSSDTYRSQQKDYINVNSNISGTCRDEQRKDDAGLCLDGCPPARGTKVILAEISDPQWQNDTSLAQDPLFSYSAGDVVPKSALDSSINSAGRSSSMHATDNVGRHNQSNGAGMGGLFDYCEDETADSYHDILVYLIHEGAEGGVHEYSVVFAMPNVDFVDDLSGESACVPTLTDECELRIVDVHDLEISVSDFENAVTQSLNITVQGLKDNACLTKKDDPVVAPGPWEVEVQYTGDSTANGLASITAKSSSQFPVFLDWAYILGERYCAASWHPEAETDIYQGSFESTSQAIDKAEWAWNTMHNIYSVYIDQSGMPQPFVNISKEDPLDSVIADSPECYFSATKDGATTDIKGAYDVVFKDLTNRDANAMIVMDTSPSMDERDGEDGKMRMDNAKTAAYVYLRNTVDWADTSIQEGDINFGFIKFDGDSSCIADNEFITPLKWGGSSPEDCSIFLIESEEDADDYYALFGDIEPRHLEMGSGTDLLDAIWLAALRLSDETAPAGESQKERYLYVFTDGYENSSEYMTEVEDLVEVLEDENIILNIVAIGEDADYEFIRRISGTPVGGGIGYSNTSDQIIIAAAELYAQQYGASMDISRKQLLGPAFQIIESQSFDNVNFSVPAGSDGVELILTNKGFPEDETCLEEQGWSPILVVVGPSGEKISIVGDNINIPEGIPSENVKILKVDDSVLRVTILEPVAGEWSIQFAAAVPCDIQALLSVHIFNKDFRLFVDVTPQVAEATETPQITPRLFYGQHELDMNMATCTSKVYDLDGRLVVSSVDFANDPQSRFYRVPPAATLSGLNYRGFYRIETTCSVEDYVKTIDGSVVGPEPFSMTTENYIFVDSDIMPPCDSSMTDDCDENYVPDIEEGDGDGDNDNWKDFYDKDNDNDEVRDVRDNCMNVYNPDQSDFDNDGIGDACDNDNFCVWGTTQTYLADRSDVEATIGSNNYIELGADSILIGSAASGGNLFLRERASVDGSLSVAGVFEQQNDVTISGAVSLNGLIDPVEITARNVNYGSSDIEVSSQNGCALSLVPGAYGSIIVRAGCSISFSNGIYELYELNIEPDATLNISGDVNVNTDYFQFGDRSGAAFVSGTNDADNLVIYTAQSEQVHIGVESVFYGHIIAPFAEVAVFSNASYHGCIHADKVLVEADANLNGDVFPGTGCGNGILDVGEECDDGNDSNDDDCLTSCQVATCSDGYWHATVESDVDCGGTCDPCISGQSCVDHFDCISLSCVNGTCSGDNSSVDVTMSVQTDWTSGYCVDFIVTNNSEQATEIWTVVINLHESQIVSLWNGEATFEDAGMSVMALDYNSVIQPGESTTFGFCADATGDDYMPQLIDSFGF